MTRRTVYFACCGDYLNLYARTLVDSVHEHDMNVACTVVNTNPADVKTLRGYGVDVVNEVTIDYEQTPAGKTRYLQMVRFYTLDTLFERYDEVYVTDVDAKFVRPIDWDLIGRYSVAFKVRTKHPISGKDFCTFEGGLFIRFDENGRDFVRRFEENIVKNGYKDGPTLRLTLANLPYPIGVLPYGYCNTQGVGVRGMVHYAPQGEKKQLLVKDL